MSAGVDHEGHCLQSKNLDALNAALLVGAPTEEGYPVIGSFDDGHTPLLITVRNGEMVRTLLPAGADVTARAGVGGGDAATAPPAVQ